MIKFFHLFLIYFSFKISCKIEEEKNPIILIPGVNVNKTMSEKEEHYFIINDPPDPQIGIRINVIFTEGKGELYVNKDNKNISNNFPTIEKYDYYATYNFSLYGFVLNIPFSDFENCNSNKLFLTVFGKSASYRTKNLNYRISFTNEIYNIEINKMFKNNIFKGDTQYFKFNIKENTKRIYISMSNKEGNADLYLNYGSNFPSIEECNFRSFGNTNEFLDITTEDEFFLKQGLIEISGEYSLMIHAHSDTFYILYISDFDNYKINTINEHYPSSCSCNNKNEICYFKYENINYESASIPAEKEIIFFVEYTYGSADLYANLYKDGNYYNILNNLPNNNKSLFNSTKRENYLRIKLSKNFEEISNIYSINSVLMFGVQCKEKSLFDVNLINLKNSDEIPDLMNLILNRDNLFYLKKGSEKIFQFYNNYNQSLNANIRAYSGFFNIFIYNNYSEFDLDNEKINEKIIEIENFDVNENGENIFSKSINKENTFERFVYFKVKTFENSLFFINLCYENDWIKIPIGKTSIQKLTNKNFYGFIDLLEEFNEVILDFHLKNNDNDKRKKIFNVYTKLNILNKSDINNINNLNEIYSIPSKGNFDNSGTSEEILNSVSLKIENVPIEIRKNKEKIIRLLFTVELKKNNYYQPISNNDLFITISTNVNHYKRLKAEQNKYYFSTVSIFNKDKTVFNILKKNKNDDLIIMEISSCNGEFDYSITDKLSFNENVTIDNNITIKHFDSKGKKIIAIFNVENKDYFVNVWGINNNNNNNNETSFLFFYYSTNLSNYDNNNNNIFFNNILSYKINENKVIIKIPDLISKNENYNNNFSLVYSTNENDYNFMESICFLSQKLNNNNNNNKIKIKFDNDNNKITVSNLNYNKKYYFNVLIENKKTGIFNTFQPIQIITQKYKKTKMLILFVLILIIIICLLLIFRYYKKYKTTKKMIRFETEDMRNMFPIENVNNDKKYKQKIKENYTNLTEENY